MAAAAQKWLGRTPNRTFILYPAVVVVFEALRRRGKPVRRPRFVPLLAWGYLEYRLIGRYRGRKRAGPPGFERAPDRLLRSGPYALTRNPMYLGHVIFLLGLALSTASPLAWLILLANVPWFQRHVLIDEQRLRQKFGREYDAYCAAVKRWIPAVL